jgi:hypothetical protein
MKITTEQISRLVRRILLEGYQNDLKELQQRYPNEARALANPPLIVNGQPSKWFKNWLVPRFLTGQVKEDFALNHAINSVQSYTQNEPALKTAFGQPVFKESLNAAFPPRFRLNNLDNPLSLTVREMDKILEVFYEYNEKKNDRLGIDYDAVNIEGDRLGKIGPWNIWMPTTRENSCAIVRVRDPETGKMRPSPCAWCTTRTKESNLFYNYVESKETNIVLYYIIKDNPEIYDEENEDFISIGFENEEMVANGETASITVSCDNTGLTEKDLKRIFGVNYTSIINLLTKKTEEIGGQLPEKTKMLEAMESLEGLNYFVKGNSREERADVALRILNSGHDGNYINPDVEKACFEYAADSKKSHILSKIIKMDNCPPFILEKIFYTDNDDLNFEAFKHKNFPETIKNNWEFLINHKNKKLENWVAQNPNCPPKILEKINIEKYQNVLAQNPNCPPEIFKKLLNNNASNILLQNDIAKNPSCPQYIFKKIINISNVYEVLLNIAGNKNATTKILKKLLFDLKNKNITPHYSSRYRTPSENENKIYIMIKIAENPNCTSQILDKLSDKENINNEYSFNKTQLLTSIAKNHKCLPPTLEKLIDYNDYDVNKVITKNPNITIEIFEKLIKKNYGVHVASSEHCPREIFEKLSISDSLETKKSLAYNPKCPPDILENLSDDDYREVRLIAIQNPNFPLEKVKKMSAEKYLDYTTQEVVKRVMEKRGIQLESLRRKIKMLLRETL